MGQITKRKGIISLTESTEGWFIINADIPLNNMFGYSGELRSFTQGKGEYTMEYARYAPVTSEVQEKLIQEYQEAHGLIQQKKKN